MRQTFLVLAGIAVVAMSSTDAEAGRRGRGRGYCNPCGQQRQVRPARHHRGYNNFACNNTCGNVCSTGCYSAPSYSNCNTCGIVATPCNYSTPVCSTGCNSCGTVVSSGCNSCNSGCGTVANCGSGCNTCGTGCGIAATPVSCNTCGGGCGITTAVSYSTGCNTGCGMTYTSGQVMTGTITSGCGTAGGCGTVIQQETTAPATSAPAAPAAIEDAPAPPADAVEDAPAPPAEEDKAA